LFFYAKIQKSFPTTSCPIGNNQSHKFSASET
jgi:hypothetical protein